MTKRPAFWIVAAAVVIAVVMGVALLSSDAGTEDDAAVESGVEGAGSVAEGDGIDLDSEGATKAAGSADGTEEGAGGSTGGSDDGSGPADVGESTDGAGGSSTDAGDATPGGDDTAGATVDGSDSADGETSLTAVAFLDDLELARPQTYRVELLVLGRQDAGGGLVYAHVETAELLGPIDAGTGEPMGDPDPDEPDHARRLETLTILATATESALGDMGVGRTETVYLVLLPTQGGATLHVDRVL